MAKNERIKEESAKTSSMLDKVKQRALAKQTRAVMSELEDLSTKIEKANCKQYPWFVAKMEKLAGESDEEPAEKATPGWCELFSCDVTGAEGGVCNCIRSGKEVAEEVHKSKAAKAQADVDKDGKVTMEKPVEVAEKTNSSGKVTQITIHDKTYDLTTYYFRDKKDCEAAAAPIAAEKLAKKQKKERAKKAKEEAYE